MRPRSGSTVCFLAVPLLSLAAAAANVPAPSPPRHVGPAETNVVSGRLVEVDGSVITVEVRGREGRSEGRRTFQVSLSTAFRIETNGTAAAYAGAVPKAVARLVDGCILDLRVGQDVTVKFCADGSPVLVVGWLQKPRPLRDAETAPDKPARARTATGRISAIDGNLLTLSRGRGRDSGGERVTVTLNTRILLDEGVETIAGPAGKPKTRPRITEGRLIDLQVGQNLSARFTEEGVALELVVKRLKPGDR